jgi:hypothetical protein
MAEPLPEGCDVLLTSHDSEQGEAVDQAEMDRIEELLGPERKDTDEEVLEQNPLWFSEQLDRIERELNKVQLEITQLYRILSKLLERLRRDE